ncbi:MAG: hypothetical protein KC474_11765 [Cyanobacteria bacterium HKST-UBA04]|nr:hypothetical protein [Cyanobacteria bacterium HKST-UBA04]MCA9842549.1 hypothetical protein [Cyanobacteria bacterium HKST-UBA03]
MIKYRLHWSMHPHKDADWYAAQCARMSEDEVARELDINYTLSVSGRVFTAYQPQRHELAGALPYNPQLPVWRIWDFGKTNAVLYGQLHPDGRRILLHERVLTDSGTVEQVRVAQEDSDQLFAQAAFHDVCDPAGTYAATRDIKPEVDYLHEHGIYPEYQYIVSLPTVGRKRRGLELVQNALSQNVNDTPMLRVYTGGDGTIGGCPILQAAMAGGYCYKKDAAGNVTDRLDEKHPYEDVVDCLLYWFLESHRAAELADHHFEPVYSAGHWSTLVFDQD